MKKWVAAVGFFLLLSQISEAVPRYAFRVSFKDKTHNLHFSNPSQFLSVRALERRAKQGIQIDENDLPVSQEYVQQILDLTKGSLHVTSKWLNSCVLWLEDSSSITSIKFFPFVSEITYVGYENEHVIATDRIKNTTTNSFPSFKFRTTANSVYYGATWTQTDFVNGDCLHDKGFRGKGKLIAILDDGFHYVNTAPAFDSVYDSGRIVDSNNFVLASSNVFTDFKTHGTLVLSTMAANIPNTYIGAAVDAQYALYVTENTSSETPLEMDNMVAAMERADSIGADIITASIGYNFFDPPFASLTPADMDGKTTIAAIGANIAAQKGILMVISAGNEGSWGLLTPGDADSALTVGNVNVNHTPAGNSGYGPNASNHTKPEVCALGQPGYVITGSLSPFTSSGTSISTPQIAGWAACLWQANSSKSNLQIKQAILQSSHLFPNPQMPQLGYGVPDFCAANVLLDVEKTKVADKVFSVYPNPFNEQVTLNLNSLKDEQITISISDVTGKAVFVLSQSLHVGDNHVQLPLPSSLAKGIYLCKVSMNDKVRTIKLVKE